MTIAGDTAPTEPVCSLADGSEVLVNECSYPDRTESPGHSTPTALGKILAGIDIDRILLTHLFSETEPHAGELATTLNKDTGAIVSVATDLTSVTLDRLRRPHQRLVPLAVRLVSLDEL